MRAYFAFCFLLFGSIIALRYRDAGTLDEFWLRLSMRHPGRFESMACCKEAGQLSMQFDGDYGLWFSRKGGEGLYTYEVDQYTARAIRELDESIERLRIALAK